MKRVAIGGPTGSGKSTLARALAEHLGGTFIELDALNHEPNWTNAETEVFRARAEAATQAEVWVSDGNYSSAQDIIWGKADTLIFLIYPFPIVAWRLFSRTMRRSWHREVLWAGNRETFSKAFFSRHSILLWLITSYRGRVERAERALSDPKWADKQRLLFRSPKQTEGWLESLKQEGK